MRFSATLLAGVMASASAHADVPLVVADIAPVHSLVAQVMAGVSAPKLLIPARMSPHGHGLKVSQARVLAEADMVFWVGETLTPWLEKALETLADDAEAVELLEIDGVILLGGEEAHHDEHENDEHDDAEHDDDVHHHGDSDPHIWLDPENAAILIPAIAEALARVDADNAEIYRGNAANALERLTTLSAELAEQMAASEGRAYVVYHDGYRYFESRFGLGRAIAIANSHAAKPGARRVAEVRQFLHETPTRCVFSERQFGTRSVDAIVRGTDAERAELDPMGEVLTPGPDLYAGLLRALATSFSGCLK